MPRPLLKDLQGACLGVAIQHAALHSLDALPASVDPVDALVPQAADGEVQLVVLGRDAQLDLLYHEACWPVAEPLAYSVLEWLVEDSICHLRKNECFVNSQMSFFFKLHHGERKK